MGVEHIKTLDFVQQLAATGMARKDITPRAYNFAYALCQQKEEMRQPRGSSELSSTSKILCMDSAAGILEAAMQEWDTQGSDGDPMLPAGEWEELTSVQRNDIRDMKDRMVRHLNAEVEALCQKHSDIKIEYRFQVEAVRR